MDAARLAAAIEARIGANSFGLWFRGKSSFRIAGDRLVITGLNAFYLARWRQQVQEAASEVLGRPMAVSFEERSKVAPAAPGAVELAAPAPPPKPTAGFLIPATPAGGRGVRIAPGPKPREDKIVRVLSEVEIVLSHWDHAVKSSRICFADQCRVCPAQRMVTGYVHALIQVPTVKGTELRHVLQSLPDQALDAFAEGEEVRGYLVKLRRPLKGPTRMEVVETAAWYELPDPLDVRQALMKIWRLPYWPRWDERDDPNVLKFARKIG